MRTLIIGDPSALTTRISEVVARSGVDCGPIDLFPLASVLGNVGQLRYELMILVLSADPEHAVESLHALRGGQSTLLAVGPANDAKLVLHLLRLGADEYLDEGELETELPASLEHWRAKQLSRSGHGRIVGLLGASGGSGASTVAANLAVLLAKWCGQAALIDMRAAASDLAALLDLKPTHGLADLCRNVGRVDANMLQQSLACHASGVHLLAAPDGFGDFAQINAQGVCEVLAVAKNLFPHIVLDLDRSLRPEQVAAVLQADLVLLVLRLDITSLRNARRIIDRLRELGVAEDRIRAVANRYGQPKELPVRKVEQALGITLAHRIPDDPAGMNLAGNAGVPVVLERPRAYVSRSLANLAAEVKDMQAPFRRNGHGPKSAALGTPLRPGGDEQIMTQYVGATTLSDRLRGPTA